MDKRKAKLIAVITAFCMLIGYSSICLDSADAAAKVSYSWPTKCHKVTGNWGLESGHYGRYHYGIDIGASRGAKVKAAEAGTVINSGLYYGYGYCVILQHANGQCTLYGHMKKGLKVKKGKKIKKGTLLGYVGGTGSGGVERYAAHLHFGVYKNKKALSKELRGAKAEGITINPKKVLR